MPKIYIIGIGYRPFDPLTEEIIGRSSLILASERLFDLFTLYEGFEKVRDKVVVLNNVDEAMDLLKAHVAKAKPRQTARGKQFQPATLLASGDPLFHGIGRRTIEEFGEEMVEIIPDLSSIQVAFSRIKEPWDDAVLISLHGGPDKAKRRRLPYELSDVPFLVQRYGKVAILTDRVNSPAAIAKELLESPVNPAYPSSLVVYVCEKLGYPDERITKGSAAEVANSTFSDPNVVVIRLSPPDSLPKIRTGEEHQGPGLWLSGSDTRFGLKEDDILHTQGLITKDEIRAVSIHKLRLPMRGVVWDIGAGSGSVSIEIARMSPWLQVFAIEKDEEQVSTIRANRVRFGTPNVKVIPGVAPDSCTDLPAPHSVFVGGSGGKLKDIIASVAGLPTATVVVNATKLETLQGAVDSLRKADFAVDVAHLSVSRMRSIGEGHSLSAVNPVFVIRGAR